MPTAYDTKNIQIRALHDNVLVSNMNFGEIKTQAGIVIRSDDGKSHGIKPRWGKIYKVGPEQKEFKVGQWILVEHGRWSRKIKINDGDGEKEIQKVDLDCILAVSDDEPGVGEVVINSSGF